MNTNQSRRIPALPIRGILADAVIRQSAQGIAYGEAKLTFTTRKGTKQTVKALALGKAFEAVKDTWRDGAVGVMALFQGSVAKVVSGLAPRSSNDWLKDPEFAGQVIEQALGWTFKNGNPLQGKRLSDAMAQPISYEQFRLRMANSVVRMPAAAN